MIPRNISAVLIRPRPLEGGGGVALLALRAESPRVHVVLRVAGTAHHGWLCLAQGLYVALRAADVRVRTTQGKASARRVIEVPQFPAVRRMARSASLTQLTFVDVFIRVAAVAVIGCLVEVLIRVALPACDGHMEAEEGVRREIVIEVDFTPLRGRVTPFASLAEGAAVWVIGTMTAYTGLTKLLLLHNTRMACVTLQA